MLALASFVHLVAQGVFAIFTLASMLFVLARVVLQFRLADRVFPLGDGVIVHEGVLLRDLQVNNDRCGLQISGCEADGRVRVQLRDRQVLVDGGLWLTRVCLQPLQAMSTVDWRSECVEESDLFRVPTGGVCRRGRRKRDWTVRLRALERLTVVELVCSPIQRLLAPVDSRYCLCPRAQVARVAFPDRLVIGHVVLLLVVTFCTRLLMELARS